MNESHSSSALVLLVEDDENDAFFFERAWKKCGMSQRIHVASDGQHALDYLAGLGEYGDRSRFPLPALIVLDLNMPRRSGLEVLRAIRAEPTLRRLVVVVLTSSASERDITEAYDLGANSYLLKTADPDRFMALLQLVGCYWLKHNQSAFTASTAGAHPSGPIVSEEPARLDG